MKKTEEVKQAVCALLLNKEGLVLGVSRRNDPENMNLPGGKVDPGETLEGACIREVFEETGLKISKLNLIFLRSSTEKDPYHTSTFTAEFSGTPEAKEEGLAVRWITWDELLKESNAFSEYNKNLFLAYMDSVSGSNDEKREVARQRASDVCASLAADPATCMLGPFSVEERVGTFGWNIRVRCSSAEGSAWAGEISHESRQWEEVMLRWVNPPRYRHGARKKLNT